MNKQIPTELTSGNSAAVLSLLADTPRGLERLSRRLSEEQRHEPLGRGERSFVQLLAHLVNCEATSSEAIYLALLLREPLLVDIHPERQLGKLLRFDQLASADLLHYFQLRRVVLMRVLRALKDTDWSKVVRQPGKQRKETVYRRARGLALHEHEHLHDLEQKVSRRASAA
jgi:hypothetical protein